MGGDSEACEWSGRASVHNLSTLGVDTVARGGWSFSETKASLKFDAMTGRNLDWSFPSALDGALSSIQSRS